MLVLNFSHPLTKEQSKQIESLTGNTIGEVKQIPVQFDTGKPFAPQVEKLVEACGLTPEEWQTMPILVVPPALNFIAVTLLANLHGRMGYFPPIVRIKPVHGAVPPRYEVAEIIDLQEVRDMARRKR
jgi:hypothetical protein